MAWRNSGEQNTEMVKNFRSMSIITTKVVENAFLNIPRAAFLPEDLQDEAYSDSPIRGDDHLHMSAPHMYATVLEALDLKPGMSFLNIGSGTGYFSMLAGYIVGTRGVNHGIELRANLVEHANECCDEFFTYKPKMKKEICYPQFIAGNCFHIDALAFKYDRVYCGAACPPARLEFLQQLVKPGGFVVVPSGTKLLKLYQSGNDTIMCDVCFEALVLPGDDEQCPRLRFAGVQIKTRKINIFPPSALLVSKTSARKSLARLRALQDVVDCLKESKSIPRAFAYVPCFTQLSQLIERLKPSGKDEPQVDQVVDFFTKNTLDTKEADVSKTNAQKTEDCGRLWSDIQNDTIWGNVVDYTYSLCSTNTNQRQNLLQVYTKVKQKKKKKRNPAVAPKLSEDPNHDSTLSKNLLEQLKNLLNNSPTSDEKPNGSQAASTDTLTRLLDTSANATSSCQRSEKQPIESDITHCGHISDSKPTETEIKTNCLPSLNKRSSRVSEDCSNSNEKFSLLEISTNVPDSLACGSDRTLCCEEMTRNSRETEKQTSSSDSVESSYQSLDADSMNAGRSQAIDDTAHMKNSRETEKATSSSDAVESLHQSLDADSMNAERLVDTAHLKSKKNRSKSCNVVTNKDLWPIKVDEQLTDKLALVPGPNWTADEDIQLVQLLINCLGSGTSKMNSKCLSKHISVHPSLFSPSVLVRYSKISSYSPKSLTFRALALFRVVHIIDCVIPFLCSTSPAVDSVTKPLSERPYPLLSFTESSFSSIKSPPSSHTSPDLTVENEADVFLTSNVENIRKHKDCLQHKIDHHRCLLGQFKEQHCLIKKQIQLIEEQEQLRQSQQRVNEQKSKRHELLGKQLELTKERQQSEYDAAQLKLQMERFHHEEVKFVHLIEIEKQKKVKKKLEDASKNVEKQPTLVTRNPKKHEESTQRYNASSILSSLRFLLPLSSRRIGIIGELLRATEQPLPDQVPVVYVDRRTSVAERLCSPETSVFYQIFDELKGENMNFRWNKRKCDQWWEVKFVGEGIIDQGGGFRDSLAELSDELCPQDPNITDILPLLVRSVNQRDQVGEYRDCFVPNPSCKDMKIFHWLGKLMGAAYRSDESLTLYFPPFVWKLLAGEHVTWCTDFAGVDEASVNLINNIEMVDRQEFSEVYATDLDFITALSDGSVVEVKDGGYQVQVDYDARLEYCELVKKTRMMESINQVKAMRSGLLSVIPQSLLELITSQELERGVCGFNEISISLLKESIHYGDELSSESDCVLQLWKVLETFTAEDRSRFLRFITGRKRLPACITLSQMCGEKDTLPSASTCASTLMLPSYSSVQIAEKKLRYAIYNCIAIDTDTSPW